MNKLKKLSLIITVFSVFFAGIASAQKPYKNLNLVFNDQIYKLNFKVNENLIENHPVHYLVIEGQKFKIDTPEIPRKNNLLKIETEFETRISPIYLKQKYEEIVGVKNQETNDITIDQDENGKITFTGATPEAGYDISFAKFYRLINDAFLNQVKYVRIKAPKKYTQVVVNNENLKNHGIKEIIAIGESNFAGSSWARKKNIAVAANLYNGVIVPRGELFSFNEILQDVSAARGFTQELVIKGNKTEKEYGGGVCQVSTTVFRAAFLGGLEIKKRRSHSYAVPYYKPAGLDATIYLGGQDFVFKNDTKGDILIQTLIDQEKNELKFVFYGTRDNRQVQVEGPFISGYHKAPAPIIEKTDKLPVGDRYLVSYSHDGFFAQWKRTLTKTTGEVEEKLLDSSYRAWPARILQGVPSAELLGNKENPAKNSESVDKKEKVTKKPAKKDLKIKQLEQKPKKLDLNTLKKPTKRKLKNA